jgi:hypothetical protein
LIIIIIIIIYVQPVSPQPMHHWIGRYKGAVSSLLLEQTRQLLQFDSRLLVVTSLIIHH